MITGWTTAVATVLAAATAIIQTESEQMIDAYINVCTKGTGTFERGSIKPINFREMPGSFQRYFDNIRDGQYFKFENKSEGYLIFYRQHDNRSETAAEICAVAIQGLSISEGRAEVLSKLHTTVPKEVRSGNREIIDIDQSGRFDIRYLYLQNMNFATNSHVGPRFLVIQTSVYD
ncbi:MAG TPA: hypothetical protein VHG29_13615 [Novosphingobium sp.]|nr:hypothetical protein [Novosphingobium sp.]